MYIIMEERLRRILAIVDDNKHNMPEGDYIQICNNLKEIRKDNSRQKIRRRINGFIKLTKYAIYIKISSNFLKSVVNKKYLKSRL